MRASALASAPGALDKAVEKAVADQVKPQAGQALGEFQPGAIEPVAPGTAINTWTYRTHVSVPILNTVTEQLKSEILGKLRGKTYKEIPKAMESYKDRIASFTISPFVDRMPSIGGIQVVDVSTVK